MDCKSVGSFVIQDKTTESIKKALHVLKKWTASSNPKMFMVGNCDEETDAVEIFFSDMLYQFLPKYQSLYQNSYINLYFCNIIFPSVFLLCFWQYYKENKQNTHKFWQCYKENKQNTHKFWQCYKENKQNTHKILSVSLK